MFEESMVESLVAPVSPARRWTMAGSFILQALIAFALATLPLLNPENLIFHAATPLVFTPPPPRPPVVQNTHVASASTSPAPVSALVRTLVPSTWKNPGTNSDAPPSFVSIGIPGGDSLPTTITTGPVGNPAVSIAGHPEQSKLVRVSRGVSAGMLLSPLRPVYPAIARATRTSGTVVVEAIISKSGTIESLHIVSGPELLRTAALDAIWSARYRPFLLNGEPTEVQTTFTVNFSLGS